MRNKTKYLINESYLDDFDESEIEDVYYDEDDEFLEYYPNPDNKYKNRLLLSISSVPKKYFKNKEIFFTQLNLLQQRICTVLSNQVCVDEYHYPKFSNEYCLLDNQDKFIDKELHFLIDSDKVDSWIKSQNSYFFISIDVNFNQSITHTLSIAKLIIYNLNRVVTDVLSAGAKSSGHIKSTRIFNNENNLQMDFSDLDFSSPKSGIANMRKFQQIIFNKSDNRHFIKILQKKEQSQLRTLLNNFIRYHSISNCEYIIGYDCDYIKLKNNTEVDISELKSKIKSFENVFKKKVRFILDNIDLKINIRYDMSVKDISMYSNYVNYFFSICEPNKINNLTIVITIYNGLYWSMPDNKSKYDIDWNSKTKVDLTLLKYNNLDVHSNSRISSIDSQTVADQILKTK